MMTLQDLQHLVEAATAGDAIAAARAAILVQADADGASAVTHLSAEQLVTMAIGSENPDFLVELGDALCAGEVLPHRPAFARSCYERADQYSPYMGAYALGTSRGLVEPAMAIQYLRRAASSGHWPSQVLLYALDIPRNPVRRKLRKWRQQWRIFWIVLKAVKGRREKTVLWRYKDLLTTREDKVHAVLGPDRDYFLRMDQEPPQLEWSGGALLSGVDAPSLVGSTKRFFVYFENERVQEAVIVRHRLLCELPKGCLVLTLGRTASRPHPLPKFEIQCPDELYEEVRRIIDSERGQFSVLCSDARNDLEEELSGGESWLGAPAAARRDRDVGHRGR